MNPQNEKDFEVAQEFIDACLAIPIKLNKLKIENLNKDAQDFILSQIRKTIGILGNFLIQYDKQK